MLEGVHYQNGYITRDIDRALALFRERSGIVAHSFEVTVPVRTPRGEGEGTYRLAFVQVNNLQYELIQPVSGLIDVYARHLPEDDSIRFHHTCMRIEDWPSFRSRVDASGYRVELEGGSEQLRYVYLDARDFVGHYLEYVWATPERWVQMGLGFLNPATPG